MPMIGDYLPKAPFSLKTHPKTKIPLCPICHKPLILIYVNGNHRFYKCQEMHKLKAISPPSNESFTFHHPRKTERNVVYMVE